MASSSSSSSSNNSQKRHGGSKGMEMEEIVRYMSNLPSYLERGKPFQDKALSFGVMDWGRLEQWQYHKKQGDVTSNKYSPSSSKSSLLFSTKKSSLKPHHGTLQSHLNIAPEEFSNKDSPVSNSSETKTTTRSRPKSKVVKKNDFYRQNVQELESSDDTGSFQTASSSSSSKGKMKIKDELVNETRNFQDPKNDISNTFPFKNDIINRKNSQNKADFERNPSACVSSKNSDLRKGANTAGKQRVSAKKTVESPPVSKNLTKENTTVSQRANSSPLKRLLDPLFSSKSTYTETPEDSKIKPKLKMDLTNCKEVRVDNSCMNKSSTKQALFQLAVKNGRPLFTFAVDNNNNDILAAAVRSLTGKDDTKSWIYTFFTVHEVKKKKGGWLSHNTKGTNHGFLPNVTAQMKVSNPSTSSNCTTREFVLSSVDPGQPDHQMLDCQLENELAGIVVRFVKNVVENENENRDCFSMTVILPGGDHSVPRKGEPSPLIERWRSGGVCDCGGWDVGCRLRTFTNTVQSNRRSKSSEKFDLFFEGDVVNERPFFSLSPVKEGIFSVEYNSSLSLLHAFSICISIIECRKSSHHSELRTYVAKQVDDDVGPVTYASLPPVSPVGRV